MDEPSANARKPLPVRISGDLLDRIDALRDPLVPRERYVRHLLAQAVETEEARRDAEETQ